MAVLVLPSAGNLVAVLKTSGHCRGVFMTLRNSNSGFFVRIVIGSCPLTILAEKLNHRYFTWPQIRSQTICKECSSLFLCSVNGRISKACCSFVHSSYFVARTSSTLNNVCEADLKTAGGIL